MEDRIRPEFPTACVNERGPEGCGRSESLRPAAEYAVAANSDPLWDRGQPPLTLMSAILLPVRRSGATPQRVSKSEEARKERRMLSQNPIPSRPHHSGLPGLRRLKLREKGENKVENLRFFDCVRNGVGGLSSTRLAHSASVMPTGQGSIEMPRWREAAGFTQSSDNKNGAKRATAACRTAFAPSFPRRTVVFAFGACGWEPPVPSRRRDTSVVCGPRVRA